MLDGILVVVALAILMGGLTMLLGGVKSFGDKS